MRLHVGTSGYSYTEWKGVFYPEKMPGAKMLDFYAQYFDSVEINNSFYRVPETKTLEKWLTQVPDSFTFVLKAPQKITHQKKLINCGPDVDFFFNVAAALGDRLGPVLFQLPPFARKDVAKLRDFIAVLPKEKRVAFEFRHASWCDDEVYALLRERDAAICLADTDEVTDRDALVIPTASWGYLRLRRTEYAEGELAAWRERVERQPWGEAFVFFKHEDEAKGPRFATAFLALDH